MTIAFITVAIILYFVFRKKQPTATSNNYEVQTSSKTRKEKEKDSIYVREIKEFDVKGIFAESSRRRLFESLDNSSTITLHLDYNNKHDKYAIKVNVDNKTIGYISRGNRKLFRTLETNSNYLIDIENKYSKFDTYHKDTKYYLSISVHLNFNDIEIDTLIKYYNLNEEFKDKYKAKQLIEAKQLAANILDQTKIILDDPNLKKVFKKHKLSLKSDINALTTCAIKTSDTELCLNLYNLHKPYIKPGKLLLSRIEKAKGGK